MRPALIAIPIVSVIALAGCASPLDDLYDRRESRYADVAAFADADDAASTDASSADAALTDDLLPDDATAIATAWYTDQPGNIITFVSAAGPADCTTGPLSGAPTLEASWWPSAEPADGTVCGAWQVFSVDSTWYAWTD